MNNIAITLKFINSLWYECFAQCFWTFLSWNIPWSQWQLNFYLKVCCVIFHYEHKIQRIFHLKQTLFILCSENTWKNVVYAFLNTFDLFTVYELYLGNPMFRTSGLGISENPVLHLVFLINPQFSYKTDGWAIARF